MNRGFSHVNLIDVIEVLKKNTTLFLWFIVSLLPLAFYGLGIFTVKTPLIENVDLERLRVVVLDDKVPASVDVRDNRIISQCDVSIASYPNVCGFNYGLGQSLNDGVDLSRYKSLSFTISSSSPIDAHSVRLQLRNFNSKYSSTSDPMSLKYLGVIIDAHEKEVTYQVSLDDFQVESWWLFRYQLGMKESTPDFTNISELIIINNGLNVPGRYKIDVHSVYVEGNVFQLSTVMAVTIAMWIAITIIGLVQYDRAIKHRLHTDALTQINNRNGLKVFLNKHIKDIQNDPHLGLIYIDLDDFKVINDTYGHDTGDIVLKTFAERTGKLLSKNISHESKYCFVRMSGDEFALVIKTKYETTVNYIAEKIQQRFAEPIDFEDHSIVLGFSIGVALDRVFDIEAKELFAHADAAMYAAKSAGKSTIRSIQNDLHNNQKLVRVSVNSFRTGFLNDKAPWHFVPLIHLKKRSLDAIEIWLSPIHRRAIEASLGNIENEVHQYQVIEQIGEFVLDQFEILFKQHESWLSEHQISVIFKYPDTTNLSLGLSEISAKRICENDIQSPLFIIALNAQLNDESWKTLLGTQKETNRSSLQLSLNNFMHDGADINLLDIVNVRSIKYSNSFIEKHLINEEFSKQFIAFNAFLKTHEIAIVCDEHLCDLDNVRELETIDVDYVDGYLMEITNNMSDIKRAHKKHHGRALT